jgi:hypothetical protein
MAALLSLKRVLSPASGWSLFSAWTTGAVFDNRAGQTLSERRVPTEMTIIGAERRDLRELFHVTVSRNEAQRPRTGKLWNRRVSVSISPEG